MPIDQKRASSVTIFAIDAGGTHTRLIVREDSSAPLVRTYPSLNPASVADPSSHWDALLRAVAGHDGELHGWIGSASVAPVTIDVEAARLRCAARKAGVTGRAILSNDMVPLLMGPPLDGVGTAVTVGTGTSFLSRNRNGGLAAASGYEYLLSDEGGAFDIGLRGLRAAARAYDGRGPETSLLEAARELHGLDIPQLGRYLAGSTRPKLEISSFAPAVCACGQAGDEVAVQVLLRAVRSIVSGVSSVLRRAGVEQDGIFLAGGVIAGCRLIATHVEEELSALWPSAAVTIAADGARSALELARRSATLSSEAVKTLAGSLPCAVVELDGAR